MSIEILPAVPDDAGELLTVQLAAYLSEARLHDSFDLPPLNETLPEVRAAIEQGRVLKAVAGTRLVGSVRGRVEGRTGQIWRLSVAPDVQRLGVGTRLLRAIEADLAGLVERFELFTGPRSESNIRLYQSLGYLRHPEPVGPHALVYLRKDAALARPGP